MKIEDEEVDSLLNSLRGQLREATYGLYAEKKWARSVEIQIFIIEAWRQPQQPLTVSDLDGPVWDAGQMNSPLIADQSHPENCGKRVSVNGGRTIRAIERYASRPSRRFQGL
jgi:hypothetical protein